MSSSSFSAASYWSVCVNKEIRRSTPAGGSAGRIAAMFGLPDGHGETLYRDFRLEMNPGQIVAVVGPSGAGKSVLLREVARRVDDSLAAGAIEPRHARRLPVDLLSGGTLKQRLAALGRCGLAEATTLVTPAGRLSDGQRYRLMLAKAVHEAVLSDQPRLLVLDEFCSTLDVTTATVLCRQIRKLAARHGLGVLLATPRVELLPALRPDAVIEKPLGQPGRYQRRWKSSVAARSSPLPDPRRWPIVRGRLADYRKLADYHYLTGPPAANKRVYVIRTPKRWQRNGGPELAAVLVVSPPVISVRGRNVATFRRYVGRDRKSALRKLNAEVECISRVIVHPMFRGSGLAVRLVKHAIKTSPMPIVESLAAMGKIHPFFARGGMQLVGLFKGPSQYYQYYITHRNDDE
ncbi:MAG: ATP-binding cassette domain-containing protein [Phycisphaerae bacterium]|nr:ATP-binding cassette domain-containing protein [Phycisphaerae bacterium]